jgi:hypothetical protein
MFAGNCKEKRKFTYARDTREGSCVLVVVAVPPARETHFSWESTQLTPQRLRFSHHLSQSSVIDL